MAHQTPGNTAAAAADETPATALSREQIDELAAKAAIAEPEPTPAEPAPSQEEPPTLATGAQGEHVSQLANLLKVLGYATNSVITEGKTVLDDTVMADVRAFKTAFGVAEPELEQIKGELIGPATWDALYNAAAKAITAIV